MRHRADPGHVAAAWFAATARRRAERVVEAGGGVFAVLDAQFPLSYEHNRVIAEHDVEGLRLVGITDEILAAQGLSHRQATVLADVRTHDVDSFRLAGYDQHERLAAMAATVAEVGGHARPVVGTAVEEVDEATVAPLVERLWREEWMPDADDETIRQLVARRTRLDRSGEVHRLAVLDGGVAVGNADLVVGEVDGVTVGEIDAVGVLAEHRRRGIGDALLSTATGLAGRSGVDLLVLAADRDDWPLRWYAARGFREVGRQHGFTRRPPRI